MYLHLFSRSIFPLSPWSHSPRPKQSKFKQTLRDCCNWHDFISASEGDIAKVNSVRPSQRWATL